MTGRYPNGWTNISTYYEPLGTEGQGGFEGWQDLASLTDVLTVGEGMKLWQWDRNSGCPDELLVQFFDNYHTVRMHPHPSCFRPTIS